MNRKSDHPDKSQMIKAIRNGTSPFAAHLAQCDTCFHQFELLSKLEAKHPLRVTPPSAYAVTRFKNVPLLSKGTYFPPPDQGKITFDSWRHSTPVDVRDITFGHVRRLCMSLGKQSVELVAELRRDGWSFVARVYSGRQVSCGYVLKVGVQRILPNSVGFYQWTSKRAPRTITLLSDDKSLEFNNLLWT